MQEEMIALMIPITAILAVFGVGSLKVLTKFLLEWRRAGGSKEIEELRRQMAEMARDYQQVKADHTDTLLGLEVGMRRLESRLDSVTGVAAAEEAMASRPPAQRQL